MPIPQATAPTRSVITRAGELPFNFVLLPVEAPDSDTFGDPTAVIAAWQRTTTKHLSFRYLSEVGRTWGCNHPTDDAKQHETLIVGLVNDWVASLTGARRHYPVIVIGFSASGYAAISLTEKHTDIFTGVVCWDSPVTNSAITGAGTYDMADWFGTEENFETNYRLTDSDRLNRLSGRRILLGGWSPQFSFRQKIVDFSAMLAAADIGFTIQIQSLCHRWDSGWLESVLDTFPTY